MSIMQSVYSALWGWVVLGKEWSVRDTALCRPSRLLVERVLAT
jgi:hypothetical protein